ncbi:hypothetical protein QL285_046240 [Trifolium repens]|nr:hypothetical protein QL285_046240 [Trifolium repens]
MSIPSQHDDFHRATMEAACLPRNQKNNLQNIYSSQHDDAHRSMMELLGDQADEMHRIIYKIELNLHIAARWLHRTAMTLLIPITKTINRASHSLLNSFRNSRTLSTIRRGSEELYWA